MVAYEDSLGATPVFFREKSPGAGDGSASSSVLWGIYQDLLVVAEGEVLSVGDRLNVFEKVRLRFASAAAMKFSCISVVPSKETSCSNITSGNSMFRGFATALA